MIEAKSFSELCSKFDLCLIVFASTNLTPEVKNAIIELTSLEMEDEDQDVPTVIPDSLCIFQNASSLRKSLPSFTFFSQRYTSFLQKQISNPTRPNPYRNTHLLKQVLIEDLMPLCPLWSSAVGPVKEPLSNAEVENNFHLMKRSLHQMKRYSEGDFVAKRYFDTTKEINQTVCKK